MDTTVTIALCIYNVEKYLPACIESCLKQTYRNIELLLVDDGSTDKSGRICDSYAQNDPRVHVVHQKNRGVSAARNTALREATGTYLAFVDADDIIAYTYIETMMSAMLREGADAGACDYIRVEEDYVLGEKDVRRGNHSTKLMSGKEALSAVYRSSLHGLGFIPWAKIFRRSLYTDHSIVFPDGKIHEDISSMYKLLYYSNKVVYCDSVQYYYRKRPNSIMNRDFSLDRLHVLIGTKGACDFYREQQEKNLYNAGVKAHFKMLLRNYVLLKENGFGEKKIRDYTDRMMEEYREYASDLTLPLPLKAAYYVAFHWKWKPLVSRIIR